MTGSCVLRVVWRLFILPLQRAQELTLTVSCQKKKKKGNSVFRRPKVTSNFPLNPQIQKQAGEVVSPCSLPRGKGTAVFVPQSPSNTQANRVPVVCCGFSCSSLRWFTSTLRTLQGALQLCAGPQLQGSRTPLSPFLSQEAGPRSAALRWASSRGRCSAARSHRGE